MKAHDILVHLAIKEGGDWDKIYNNVLNKVQLNEDDVKNSVASLKCKAVTLVDHDYPSCLKLLAKPPFVLFYYGDWALAMDNTLSIAVVGSRKSSEYGERITNVIVSDLAKRLKIVSGLAAGIDACSHRACINAGGQTIAVLGCGIDVCYPPQNQDLYDEIKQNHLLVSEYPGEVQPKKEQFPMRNRIIAALSRSLLVTEAYAHSGTSITIGFALAIGHDVYVVPHEAGKNSACNRLIREGAVLVENAEHVFYEMGIK